MPIQLPQELISAILSRLPVKALVRFRCVSKTWLALIKDPTFINLHLHNSRECNLIVQTSNVDQNDLQLNFEYYLVPVNFSEDQPVKVLPPIYCPEYLFSLCGIIGSCNGLVCFRTYDKQLIVIWNPSIRKYKKLPFEPVKFEYPTENFAFGYDSVNNDYKVLKIMEFGRMFFEVHVYSLKAHSWRLVEDKWPFKGLRICSKPIYFNGTLLWLVKNWTDRIRLLAFRLTTEKFEEQTLPVEPRAIETLDVLEGSICVSAYRPDAQCIDFWIMKETNWTQLCTLPVPLTLLHTFLPRLMMMGIEMTWRVVFSTDDGEKVLMEMVYNNNKNYFWYDIKKKTHSNALTHIGKMTWIETCVGSLFILDGDSV
ncbi:F-box/kelch-repeat protein At3g06240-like [Corylus avellana]|uniref:F-box/kelch-repeat protein At3g06240-like n=1 Tax=Corylus avellana TaxID=13451 RepID=UPI00286C4F6E|nr:F-box/kelch-repeat protein At3g06240-like [Corylus avellana]XP_059460162.1 F-box/kelch-repeat protein At3g06240-like [Corylus avellana]